ncbi:MAG: tetratricopeptide repeat protein [Acidobacteria bacterium]|nr:tetratricopeptide repeat protein [Acidobacteriota bacterium]
MSFPKIILIAVVLAGASLAAHGRARADDAWLRVQSKNFQIVGSADERSLRAVAVRLERFRDVFTQLFPQYNFSSPIPTRVVVFRDEASYRPFKLIDWANGYFLTGDDVNYIVLAAAGESEDTYPTIYHEYTHFLIDNTLGRTSVPPWFNEGMAEFYERFEIENDRRVTLGAVNENHLAFLRQNRLIPFETFFAVDYYSLNKQSKTNAELFYAQSWLLVHYLLESDGGAKRERLSRFVELLMKGARPKPAFEEAFGTDYAALEAELRKYLAGRSLPSTVVTVENRPAGGEITVSPVSESAAKAFQGDLLYHSKRFEEAEKTFAEALALDPGSALANSGLGLVLMRRNRFFEASGYFEKAIKNDPQNYLYYYNYAFAVSRQGLTDYGFASTYAPADAARMRENLRRAIALNPDFAESYNLLAFVNVVRNEEIDESLRLIDRALAIAPGNQWYLIRRAELLMRKEQFAKARELTARIVASAPDDRLKVYAENTLRMIDSLESMLADIRDINRRRRQEEVTDEPLSEEEIARRREKALLESLNAALRRPRSGEQRLLGAFTKIECRPNRIRYTVSAGGRVWQFETETFETLYLISYANPLVNSEFGCGEVNRENLAVVTFRPGNDKNSPVAGELVAVEFVPKNFRFLENGK